MDQLLEFTYISFGLSTAPYLFTKMMKPVMTNLRSSGNLAVTYLDDLTVFGHSDAECKNDIYQAITFLKSLSLIINFRKSSLTPITTCTYFGFTFDSVT